MDESDLVTESEDDYDDVDDVTIAIITQAMLEEQSQAPVVPTRRKYDKIKAAETKRRHKEQRERGEAVSPAYKPKHGRTRKYVKSGKFRCAPDMDGNPRRPRNFSAQTKTAYEQKESIFCKKNNTTTREDAAVYEDAERTSSLSPGTSARIAAQIATTAALAAKDACTLADIEESSKKPLEISPLKVDDSMDPIFSVVDALVALDKHSKAPSKRLSPRSRRRIAVQRKIAQPEYQETSFGET